MISSTRTRVSSLTNGDWLSTRETVFFDTLASRAMSLIVGLRSLSTVSAGSPLAGAGCVTCARAGAFFDFFAAGMTLATIALQQGRPGKGLGPRSSADRGAASACACKAAEFLQ